MKAVLLAAGVAQRLKGIVDDIPKPMVLVDGIPILQHNVEWLKSFGVTDIYINLHHLPDVITRHFGNGDDWGVHITYSWETSLLGTAGAVKKIAQDYWKNDLDGPFLVVYGDNLVSDFDLSRITNFHKKCSGLGTICLYRKPDEVAKSGVAVLDEQCRIVKFVEKPAPNEISGDLVNTGIYVLEPAILEYISQDGCFDFAKDVFSKVLNQGKPLYGLVLNANLIAIDTPQLFKKLIASEFAK